MNLGLVIFSVLLAIFVIGWPMFVFWMVDPLSRPFFEYLADKADFVKSQLHT